MVEESQNPNYAADEEPPPAHPETQPCKQPKFTPTTLKNVVAQEAMPCPPISIQPVKKRNTHLKVVKMNTKAKNLKVFSHIVIRMFYFPTKFEVHMLFFLKQKQRKIHVVS